MAHDTGIRSAAASANRMKRREFITLLGGGDYLAFARRVRKTPLCPLSDYQRCRPVGYFFGPPVEGFDLASRDHGFVEGQTHKD